MYETRLSLPTVRSSLRQSTSGSVAFRNGMRGENAGSASFGFTANDALKRGQNAARNALAASISVIPAFASSCGSRPCSVPNTRSLRPRAYGE